MPPLRPQRNIPKPRRYQSSSSEAEKTEAIKKRGRQRQTIKTDTQKLKKQADSVKENIMAVKRVLKLQTAQVYKPIPLCLSNSSPALPTTQEIPSCSNTSWKNAITTIAQIPARTSITSRSPTIETTSASILINNMACAITANHENGFSFSPMQCSTTTTSTPFSSNIANAKSMLNHKNQCPSVSSLQYPTTTTSMFVTSNNGNVVTFETTYRYNCLISDTIKHTAPFANSSYVSPSWEPIPHQRKQVTHATACNSASSICDPIVYAMRTSLTSNADHVGR